MSRGDKFKRRALKRGYKVDEVDEFLERCEATIAGEPIDDPVVAADVRDVVFRTRWGGYDEWQVDLHLDRMERELMDLAEGKSSETSNGFASPRALLPAPERPALPPAAASVSPAAVSSPPLQPAPSTVYASEPRHDMRQPDHRMDHRVDARGVDPRDPRDPRIVDSRDPRELRDARSIDPRGADPRGADPRMDPRVVPAARAEVPQAGRPMPPVERRGDPRLDETQADIMAQPRPPRAPERRAEPHTPEARGAAPRPEIIAETQLGAAAPAADPFADSFADLAPASARGAYEDPFAGHTPKASVRESFRPTSDFVESAPTPVSGAAPLPTSYPMADPPPRLDTRPRETPAAPEPPRRQAEPTARPAVDPYAGRHGKAEMTQEMPAYAGKVSPFTDPDKSRLAELRASFKTRRFGSGYDSGNVERFFDAVSAAMNGQSNTQVTDADFDARQFPLVQGGYFEEEIDAALEEMRELFKRRLG
ncbi:MAG: DivIVA domain-containing protein [Corynebacteriales bacterium]|nr:DivIVA domain-containing protein [Mycobacteriales bacterium]